MIKHFITKRSFRVLFLFLVIKPLVTVYHHYAIFFRPISPSTEISELHAGINYYCIIVVNRSVVGNVYSILQSETNRCNSDFSFIKKQATLRSILFERCTAQTLVMLYISTQYTNKCKTISPVKLFGASLNRSSGIKRGQPHNAYNIIITDTKQRQPLCFFCVVVRAFGRIFLCL